MFECEFERQVQIDKLEKQLNSYPKSQVFISFTKYSITVNFLVFLLILALQVIYSHIITTSIGLLIFSSLNFVILAGILVHFKFRISKNQDLIKIAIITVIIYFLLSFLLYDSSGVYSMNILIQSLISVISAKYYLPRKDIFSEVLLQFYKENPKVLDDTQDSINI